MVSVFKAGNLVALAVPKDIEMLLEMDSWDFFCCLKRKIFQNRKNLDIGFDDFMPLRIWDGLLLGFFGRFFSFSWTVAAGRKKSTRKTHHKLRL